MDADEERKRKAEKKEKKEKREKKEKKEKRSREDSPEPTNKRKDRDEEVADRAPEKKVKLSETVSKSSSSSATAADWESPEADIAHRRRTRSISDADEKYKALVTPEDYRAEHQITISGESLTGGAYVAPAPMTLFSMTPFAVPIRKALDAAGFHAPTATQAQSWPIALQGRDIITVAKTGSGKTIGFLLPAFHRMTNTQDSVKRGMPRILVLAPTRELAMQIEEECVKFGRASNIRSCCCYGGAPKGLQIGKIQRGLEVIIATPGRLNDLIEMKVVNLSSIIFLVLDEADRMLDMGFEPQIRKIISMIPSERQSMMFTATWPKEVQMLAMDFLKKPIEIKFGVSNQLNANKAIIQDIRVIAQSDKDDSLKKIIEEINPGGKKEQIPKTIIFVSRKDSCDDLANSLWNSGYAVDSLHGDKAQFQRTRVFFAFTIFINSLTLSGLIFGMYRSWSSLSVDLFEC